MKKILNLIAICMLMSGCCHQKFDFGGSAKTIPTYEGTSHFIFWGLGQTKEVDPNEICGSRGVASVETGQSFWLGFASALTWGIYEPREYRIYCNTATRSRGMNRTRGGRSTSMDNYYRYDDYYGY